jgi:anti-repressor protein|nr:MAG TPA: antirepressor protein [Caudoviricetes sp.]
MENISNTVDIRTPIEIALDVDTEGMTTARKLYEFLEMDKSHYSRWVKTNITENEFATENEDYFYSPSMANENNRGNFADDYKLTAHFAKKLSVKGNSEKAEQAREYFTRVEEKVKENVIDRSQLSPQLQLMNMLVESMNKQELIQKQQAKQIAKVETTVSTLKEIFIEPIGDWKNDINSRVREISKKSGVDYQTLYSQLYGELETTAHCSLKRLQNNKKARMEKAGNTKTAIKDGTTKIAVIYDRPQLKAIFEGIVKRYAMRYCV